MAQISPGLRRCQLAFLTSRRVVDDAVRDQAGGEPATLRVARWHFVDFGRDSGQDVARIDLGQQALLGQVGVGADPAAEEYVRFAGRAVGGFRVGQADDVADALRRAARDPGDLDGLAAVGLVPTGEAGGEGLAYGFVVGGQDCQGFGAGSGSGSGSAGSLLGLLRTGLAGAQRAQPQECTG